MFKNGGKPNYIWITIFFAVFIWSAIHPLDYFVWALEVAPAVIAIILMVLTRKSFELTPLLSWVILFHCIVLIVGGHYTYAEVPLFDSIKEIMGSARNNYDKLGHFMQGFAPALLAREILLKKNVVNGSGWSNVIIVSICLAFSAFYEMLEWWVSVLSGSQGDAFLATQGYVWDTQSDMFYALVGAIVALMLLSRLHDRQLQRFK